MQLIYYPNKTLTSKCKAIPDLDVGQILKDRARLASKMWEIMNKSSGVGLAAPQVGLNIRMFVWKQNGFNQAIWNPKLNCLSGSIESVEGCLSLPGVSVILRRASSSILNGTGFNSKPVRFIGNITTTRIWQHEIDHLDGKLIIDDMSDTDAATNKIVLESLLKNTVT